MRDQLAKWQETNQEIIVWKKDGECIVSRYIESFDDLGIVIKQHKDKPVSTGPANPLTIIPWVNVERISTSEYEYC